jgi:HEAT repeat protein
MGLYQIKKISIIFFLCFCFMAEAFCDEQPVAQQIAYAMHAGQTKQAIELYQKYQKSLGHHDLDLVHQMGIILLDQGSRSDDLEIQVLTIFGAGISTNEKALYIFENALQTPVPQLQLAALNFLAKHQDDAGDEILLKGLSSNYLLIRLETLHYLTEKRHAKAAEHIEALMCKIDPELLPLFPPLFAALGDAASVKHLKKLLTHSNQKVRLAAILSAAKFGRDDLLPQIRILSSHHEVPQQEACAYALGMMRDEHSTQRLEAIALSKTSSTRLAALQALYRLGRKEAKIQVESLAKSGDIFAIAILGDMPGSEPVLRSLLQSPQLQIKINAGLALLQRSDPACLQILKEILVYDARDLCFQKIHSIGGSLAAWKVVPSGRQNLSDDNLGYEISLSLREETLEKALNLPEKDFIQIATLLLENHQNDLIPTLAELLQQWETEDAVALLKKYQQKAGAPLIRNYCNLALFSLGKDGPYSEILREWMTNQQSTELIRFRPYVPWEAREAENRYELTPQETSRLLVQSLEAFAKMQNDQGLDALLDAIANGNAKNKYALAGLLIRAAM